MNITSKQQLREVLMKEASLYEKKWYYDLPIYLTEQQILYKHMKYLRKAEYACAKKSCLRYFFLLRLLRLQTRYGISIPLNVVGKGFYMVHLGSVIINCDAKIGEDVKVHPGVCIGANHGRAPRIGNRVYIGPGAKVFGDILIADDIQIGANAVVNKSCEVPGASLVGNPSRMIEPKTV